MFWRHEDAWSAAVNECLYLLQFPEFIIYLDFLDNVR